MIILALRNSIC